MITIIALSKSYGPKKVLHDVNLTFEAGRVYGIVGENGAGKTTLFKCMAGLEPHSGLVTCDKDSFKDNLGYLPTDPYFFQKITGREYVQLLCNARETPLEGLAQKNIFELPLDQYAATYSTGMKKKLALLAILLQKNEYFILDEPFNGVDIQSNILITEIIHRLKALGKTVLISSHIFATLQETCDEIFLLKEGTMAKKVLRAEFSQLEQEMKAVTIGNTLERLALQ